MLYEKEGLNTLNNTVVKTIPYAQLSDIEKISKNWNKTLGLYNRREYSNAVVRCCTCLELGTNYAIRQEFAEYGLPIDVVNKLLRNSNGLSHKYNKLYLPLIQRWDHFEAHKKLWRPISKINLVRNNIVHGGEFKNKKTASNALKGAYRILDSLLEYCEPRIRLKEPSL